VNYTTADPDRAADDTRAVERSAVGRPARCGTGRPRRRADPPTERPGARCPVTPDLRFGSAKPDSPAAESGPHLPRSSTTRPKRLGRGRSRVNSSLGSGAQTKAARNEREKMTRSCHLHPKRPHLPWRCEPGAGASRHQGGRSTLWGGNGGSPARQAGAARARGCAGG
jgi:hypothetical protein